MRDPVTIAADLRGHLALCEELLLLVERENQLLRATGDFPAGEFYQRRKRLLPLLDASVQKVKAHRVEWQRAPVAERRQSSEAASLIRLIQDLIMKILMLDRENEQILLRRGLLSATRLPPPARQRPHFVADLYRRHSQVSTLE